MLPCHGTSIIFEQLPDENVRDMSAPSEKIAVIGLGYVGLPVAVGLATKFTSIIGFDISTRRISALRQLHDWTGEVSEAELKQAKLKLTDDSSGMKDCNFFIVTVPTPIDGQRPDLSPLESACKHIGPNLKAGGLVVFESTVYPGVTEDFCGPLLEKSSGLKRGKDFKLGYSPERINPGDKQHRLETITKIISAEDEESLERMRKVYGSIIRAGLYEAQSIRVAESAKVLENTQRDINIALMNELAIIMDRMNIRTRDVLDAAGTKWNFLKFTPGLVGGHCIGVDPYYLTSAAEALGYHPEVILAGRRLNDNMGKFVAAKAIKLLAKAKLSPSAARIGVLGLTFKENVPDIRNSKVPDILSELREFGATPLLHDPMADVEAVQHEYQLELSSLSEFRNLDVLILAVNHRAYLTESTALFKMLRPNGIFVDVKSAIPIDQVPDKITYWSL
jgi:UDP-N-acetyl-D-glucosamine/UDP-N-acetyl-D-galactosamine dehydrogenase